MLGKEELIQALLKALIWRHASVLISRVILLSSGFFRGGMQLTAGEGHLFDHLPPLLPLLAISTQ